MDPEPSLEGLAELVKGEKPEVSGKSMECEAEKRLQCGEGGGHRKGRHLGRNPREDGGLTYEPFA